MVAEMSVGEGGTTNWYLGGLDRNSSIAVMLDLAPALKETNPSKSAMVQFVTTYRHSSGRVYMRVTSVVRRFADNNNMFEL